jgi:hypothetical protein
VVYMAEQHEPVRRRVALKIIKLGMDTKNVIARFEAERQALALMDHPNIARVLDAGATHSGRPYFVMELVRGIKITEFCDQNHLDNKDRLDLFIQVCHAIQHAHQKGIIHRDIKPSNILVTLHDGVAVPKIIDFGIAKATGVSLTDRTLFTPFSQFIGTPAYMSPEQAEMSGLDVDTRSDIYSLGVLLYELLTGRTPFDPRKLLESGLDEMRRTLRETEPQRPSTMVTTLQGEELKATALRRHAEPPKLISALRGDLDWIVMKALDKDRARRYQTANGLAMDIQRHLSNEAVLARPPSRAYQFQKLVRRNQGVFAATAAVAAALILGLAVSMWLLVGERTALQRATGAERQQERLRQEADLARQKETTLRRQAELRQEITQAAFLLTQERPEEADAIVEQVSIPQPFLDPLECAAVLRTLGEWHALAKRWPQAVQRYSALLQVDQLDGPDFSTLDHLACGAALAQLGDHQKYDQFREAALARFAHTTDPLVAERIVKISLLLPADNRFLAALTPLAELAMPKGPVSIRTQPAAHVRWRQTASGGIRSENPGLFPRSITRTDSGEVPATNGTASVLASHDIERADAASAANPASVAFSELGLKSQDFNTGQPFSQRFDGDAATITAGGANIWDAADQFLYTYLQATNDFDYRLRIRSITGGGGAFTRAGLMARDSLTDSGSHHVTVARNSQDTFQVLVRPVTGSSNTLSEPPNPLPEAYGSNSWVRLQRVGTVFYTYASSNGVDWAQLFQFDSAADPDGPFANPIYVGIATCAWNTNGTPATFEVSNLGQTPTVPVNSTVSLALMEYRRHEYAKAIEWCRRCLAYPEYNVPRIATAHIILALASHQLHQPKDGRAELAQGQELIDANFKSSLAASPQGFWFDWIFAQVLSREAAALIQDSSASK